MKRFLLLLPLLTLYLTGCVVYQDPYGDPFYGPRQYYPQYPSHYSPYGYAYPQSRVVVVHPWDYEGHHSANGRY